jgi:hypothetical protein
LAIDGCAHIDPVSGLSGWTDGGLSGSERSVVLGWAGRLCPALREGSARKWEVVRAGLSGSLSG